MGTSDQRSKRKRFLRQPSTLLNCLSARFLLICFGFLSVISLLSYTSHLVSSAFRPVLMVSSLSLLSSSSSTTFKSIQYFDILWSRLKIESRVLFPEHVLLLVSGVNEDAVVKKNYGDQLECVYYGKVNGVGDSYTKKALSLDEYDGFRLVVRCPIPSSNYSNAVDLKRCGKNGILAEKGMFGVNNQKVHSCDSLAYAAALDGNDVVVFVKGLNLRPDRESDPSPFSCHFELEKCGKSERLAVKTKALTAAQEVVRCSLPMSISSNLDKAQAIHVTIGVAQSHEFTLLPSVAAIFDSRPGVPSAKNTKKYELCVCTMVWNQASAIHEWIMYHSWLGVQRWFIYDNNSDDEIDKILDEFDSENYNVTRHVWPWIKTQEAGFSNCALRAKDVCTWVAFMDVDEYFRFRPSNYASQNSLRFLVANLSSSAASIAEIRSSCYSFGPSGSTSLPTRGVTAGYTCRLQSPERHKSIIRPDALDPTLLNVVHHFRLKHGFEFLNLHPSVAVINHYKYQVWEVFRVKFHRRVATYVADWRENQNEGSRDRAPGLGTTAVEPPDWPRRFCEVWDTGLRDFVVANLADVATGLLPWENKHSALPF